MTHIKVFYKNEEVEGYTLDTTTNQIHGKHGKPLKYQKNNKYVYIGRNALVSNVVRETLEHMCPVDAEVKDTVDVDVESLEEVFEINKEQEEFKDWVSMNLIRAEAMEILEQADDVTYWEFQEMTRNHIAHNGIVGVDESDIMIELVIRNYIEPRKAVKGCHMKREYEFMTFEEIAKDLDIPFDANYADALKEYWIKTIRRTYIDKIQYRRGYISMREFSTIVCPLGDFREVIGAWSLLICLFEHRNPLY